MKHGEPLSLVSSPTCTTSLHPILTLFSQIKWTFSFSTYPFIPTWLFIPRISFCLNLLDYPPPHFKRSLSSYSFQKVFLKEVAASWPLSPRSLCSVRHNDEQVTYPSSENTTKLLTRLKGGLKKSTLKQNI